MEAGQSNNDFCTQAAHVVRAIAIVLLDPADAAQFVDAWLGAFTHVDKLALLKSQVRRDGRHSKARRSAMAACFERPPSPIEGVTEGPTWRFSASLAS